MQIPSLADYRVSSEKKGTFLPEPPPSNGCFTSTLFSKGRNNTGHHLPVLTYRLLLELMDNHTCTQMQWPRVLCFLCKIHITKVDCNILFDMDN